MTLNGILLEALAIAIVVKVVIGKKMVINEILMFTALVTAMLLVLDIWAPDVGRFTRQGAGFGIGYGQVGGGIQAALGLQRTLKGHDQQHGGNVQAALGLQRTLAGNEYIQTGGMDDPVALDYYKTGNVNAETNHAVYDSLISTGFGTPLLNRFANDRSLLNRNEVVTVKPHAMEALIKKETVKEIEGYRL